MNQIKSRCRNKACERCGRHINELEPFDGENEGAYLVKVRRYYTEEFESGTSTEWIEATWECRECVKEGVILEMAK